MQKYEEAFGYLHASFVTIACIYRNSCEELLSPLALSDAQLFQLLENRESSAWENPELNDALRDRLGSNYLPFKSSVKQLNKKVNLFGRKLQLDKDFQLAKHHIHTLHLPSANTTDKRVTLQEVMTTQGTTFQIKEKCTLALTLASAVYHLHNTPWLEETWDLNDICILSQSLLSDQPYISREFPATAASPAQNQRMRIIKNSIIFALGVALLEISYGKPLNTFATSEDLDANGNRTAFTDYLIADRLAEGLRTRELPNYADATQRCIHCNFEASVYSLDDDDFRERFYQGAIVPLRKDYEYVVSTAVA
ncbi:unnamed protein product [Alternaria alternata]